MDRLISKHYSIDDPQRFLPSTSAMRNRQEMYRAAIKAPAFEHEEDISVFDNKVGLAEELKFLASMPELCDITFFVGDDREPVCAVKAILAARSKVFEQILFTDPSPVPSPIFRSEPMTREQRLMMFSKRSSEPLINISSNSSSLSDSPSGSFLDSLFEPVQEHTTMEIDMYEPDVFRQIIEYIHIGSVTLQPRTLLGLLNGADYYALEELKHACLGFVEFCINVDTVCVLLSSAEKYLHYKCTKSLIQRVLEFIDEHGNDVLALGTFTLLPLKIARLVFARETLQADEFAKFQAALLWCKKFVDTTDPPTEVIDAMANFSEFILFHKIPATVLMTEVHPLNVLPYSIIMNALAFQADPISLDPEKLSPAPSNKLERSMSIQSGVGENFGSSITLSSTHSSDFPISVN